ncbi:MAG: NAD(P)-dependent oxidoreductase [Candidatus Pacebacteria bacterium]|nr:NAD(P)-dependent oxidoreductase [Candidatus Paceibacterota bacterium]
MKILVIGGTSNLAKYLVKRLRPEHETITMGRSHCDIVYDFKDSSAVPEFPGSIDSVINTVAHFSDQSPDSFIESFAVNLVANLKLMNGCIANRVGHYISVSSIYAICDLQHPNYGDFAVSKRFSDEAARLFATRFNLPLTILRPTQLIGNPESIHHHQPFYRAIIQKAWRGEDIIIYGSHDPKRNFLHYEDLAEVISRVIKDRVLGTFVCQYPADTTLAEVAKTAIEVFKSQSQIKFLPDKPDIADNVFAYDDSLYRLLDWYPQLSLKNTIERECQIFQWEHK